MSRFTLGRVLSFAVLFALACAPLLAQPPSVQASNIIVTDDTPTSISLSWTRGNGLAGVTVLMTTNTSATLPTLSGTYTANSIYGLGQLVEAEWYVVFDGNASGTSVTGLSPNTDYRIYVSEYSFPGPDYFNGSSTGNPVNHTTLSAGNSSLDFDGVDDHIAVGNLGTMPAQGTFEAWVWSDFNDSNHGIMDTDIANTTSGFRIEGSAASDLYLYNDNGSGYHYFYSSGQPTGQWIHLAFTWNTSTSSVIGYVNGVEVFDDVVNQWPSSFPSFILGTSFDNISATRKWDGRMDDIRLWQTQRTVEQINAFKDVELTGSEPGLMLYYDFSEGTGTNTADDSGNGFVGSLVNGPTWITTGPTLGAASLDSTPPTVAISGPGFVAGSFQATFTFSEDVLGFDLSDIQVSNGTPSNVQEVSPSMYTADITPITDGILTIDVNPGAFSDLTGNGNTSGAPQFSTTVEIQTALNFNGTSGYVSGTGINLASSDFTVESWFNTNNIAANQAIFALGSSGTNNQALHIVLQETSVLIGFFFSDVTIPYTVSSGWHHIAVTHDSGTLTSSLYIDGVFMGSAVHASGGFNGNSNFFIGRLGWDPTGYFNGLIDEVRVWNTERTVEQINFFKDVELNGPEPGLIGYWDFEDGAGSLLTDYASAGGNNTGTLNSMNTSTDWVTATHGVLNAGALDAISPTPVISTLNAATDTPITIDIDFGEEVVNFEASDIVVTDAILTNFINVDNQNYTADLYANSVGTITANIAPAAALDLTGNASLIASEFSFSANSPNNALVFDGSNDFVSTSYVLNVANDFTLEAWVNLSSASSSNDVLFGGGDNWWLGVRDTGVIRWAFTSNLDGTTNLRDDTWHHIAVTGVAGNYTVYLDGQVEIASTPLVSPASAAIRIGSIVTPTFTWQGMIDEVRIWTVGRTPTELTDNLSTTLAGDEAGLALYYRFDETSGTLLPDLSGNGNNGTLSNMSGTEWVASGALADIIAPSVTITSTESGTTTLAPFPITVTFSESVADFDASDITVSNGVVANFAGSGTTYTADIYAVTAGQVDIDVLAGVATDGAANPNTASNSFSIIADFPENAMNFDGTSGTINLGTGSAFNYGTSFSFEAWIRPESYHPNGSLIFNKWQSGLEDKMLELTSTGTLTTYLHATSSASTTQTLPLNQWSHVAVVYDNSTIKIYINGVESASASASGDLADGTGTMFLGYNPDRLGEGGKPFDGSLDEVRFWNVARTQQEIIDNVYTSLSSAPGLVASYNFNNSSGNAIDLAGVNDGTLEGGVAYLASDAFTTDIIAPSVTITSTESGTTELAPFPITVTFSESVADFDASDITVTNGVVANFAGSGTTYTADIYAVTAGQVDIDVLAGVATDGSANSNLASNTFSITASFPENAMSFDGADDYINLDAVVANFDFNAPATIEFWLKADTDHTIATQGKTVFSLENGTDQEFLIMYGDIGTGLTNERIVIFYETANSNASRTGVGVVDPTNVVGEWHHYALVMTGTEYQIYIDGVLRTTTNSGSYSNPAIGDFTEGFTPNSARIGMRLIGQYLDGQLDEFRLWNTARTQQEIVDNIYTSLSSAPSLVASYNFNNSSGDAIDAAGTNDGTLQGGVTYVSSDAFSTDILAPVINSLSISDIGVVSLDVDYDINEISTLHYLVINDGGAVPSVNNVINSGTYGDEPNLVFGGSVGSVSIGTLNLSGLAGGSTYDLYFVAVDAGGNPSVLGSLLDITTDAPNYALDFDGTDDYVNLGNSMNAVLGGTDQLTVEAWVYRTSGKTFHTVVGNYTSGGIQFLLRLDNDKPTFWVSSTGTPSLNAIGVTSVPLNTWTHVAGTYDGANLRVYINGVLDGTTAMSGPIASSGTVTSSVTIGGNPGAPAGELMQGAIDEVRIWTVARTQQQIANYMNEAMFGNEPGLLAYHDFSAGPNSNITWDVTANGYNGVLENMDLANDWIAADYVLNPAGTTPDITAPVLSNLQVVDLQSTDVSVSIDLDEQADLWYVLTGSADVPTAGQIKLGQDHTGASAIQTNFYNDVQPGTEQFSIGGLTQGTQYFVHWVGEDAALNVSNVLSTSFTTPTPVEVAFETLPVAPANLVPGSSGNLIYKLSMTVTGTATMIGMFFQPNGTYSESDFTQFSYYQSIGTDDFQNASLIGTNGFMYGQPPVPDGNIGLFFNNAYTDETVYWYITADVSAGAGIGNTFGLDQPLADGNFGIEEERVEIDNGLAASSVFILGTVENALDFDGVDDHVVLSNVGLPSGNAPRTIEGWVKTTATAAGNMGGWGASTSTANARFQLLMTAGGTLMIIGETNDMAGTIAINDGAWHHVAAVHDGTHASIYVDGVLDVTQSKTYNTGTDVFVMGKRTWANDEHFMGQLDNFRFWSDARTQEELIQHANQVLTTGDNLLAAYDFNQASGTNLPDISSNGLNGTLTNFNFSGTSSDWVSSVLPDCLQGLTFTAAVDNNWFSTANWCGGVVPDIAEPQTNTIIIEAGTISLGAVNALGEFELTNADLIIMPGASLDLNFSGTGMTLAGSARIVNYGTLNVYRPITLLNQADILNYGELNVFTQLNFSGDNDFVVPAGAVLRTTSAINGSLTVALGALFGPGASPGCTPVDGNYTNAGTLEIELGGLTPCTEYDQVQVTGTANLGGTLDVLLFGGFTPADLDEFVIIDAATISGTFDVVNFPDANWSIQYNSPAVGQVSVVYDEPLAPPAAPTDLIAYSFSPTGIGLEWTDVATDNTGYRLESASDYAFTSPTVINNVADGNNAYFDINTNEGRFFRVTATNGAEDASSASVVEFATTVPFPAYALGFDGVDDQIVVPHQPQLNFVEGDFTLEAWVYVTGASDETILSKGDGNGDGFEDVFIFQVRNDGTLGLELADAGLNFQWRYSTGTVPSNEWAHVAVTYQSGNVEFFVNGSSAGATTFTITPSSHGDTNPMYIGRQGSNCACNFFNGQIDEVRIWNTIKTDFSDRYGNLLGNEANLVAYYPLDENTGAKVVDRSRNIADGDITGAVYSASSVPTLTPPVAPTNLIAYASAAGEVTLEWTDNATNETAYRVETADDFGFTANVQVADGALPANSTTASFIIGTNQQSFFRVTPVNGAEDGSSLSSVEFASTVNFPGTALQFDRVDDYMTANTGGALNVTGAYAVEAWVKPSSTTGSMVVFSTRTATTDFGFDMQLVNGNTIHADIGNGTSWITTSADASYNYAADEWIHVAYVVDNTGYGIYVNGVQQTAVGFSSTPVLLDATHDFITIGAENNNGGTLYGGEIDEVRVWNYAKSNFSDRNGPLQGNEAGLVAYFTFDENTGATAVDRSRNTNDGAILGAVYTPSTASLLPPAAPTDLIVYASSAVEVILEWTDNATDETDFLVEWATDYAFTNIIGSNTVPANTASMQMAIGADVGYFFRVTPRNGAEDATSRSSVEFATTEAFPGHALLFDQTDDFVEVPANNELNFTGSFTAEAWVYVPGTAGFRGIVSQWGTSGSQRWEFLVIDGSNVVRFHLSDNGTNDFNITTTDGLTVDTWYHVAVVYDAGTSAKIFIDGVEQSVDTNGTLPASLYSNPALSTYVGRSLHGGNYFNGLIDDVRIWNYAKTGFADRFDVPIGNEPNLIAYFPFDENTGTKVVDRTVNINDGDIVGGAGFVTSGVPTSAGAPEINVKGTVANVPIASGSSTPLVSNDTDFGLAEANELVIINYTIENTGTANLNISDVSVDGDFSIANIAMPAVIPPAGQVTFDVGFQSVTPGSQQGTVVIENDDADESVYTFVVGAEVETVTFNFFEDFVTGIPGSWTTLNAFWEDNPSLGLGGVAGNARIASGNGNYLQTPFITDMTEFSFYFRAQNAGGDGAQFDVQFSADGVGYSSITTDGTLADTYTQFNHNFGGTTSGYIRIVSLGSGDQNIMIDDFASDGTEGVIPTGVTEDFETLSPGLYNTIVSLPTGDWEFFGAFGEDNLVNSGAASLGLDFNSSGYLVTPEIDGDGTTVDFYYATTGGESHFTVFKSVNGGNFNPIDGGTATSPLFNQFVLNLNDGPGSNVRIMVVVDDISSDNNLYIDDFSFVPGAGGITAPSAQAYDISFSNIQQNTADISWTNGNGMERIAFIIEGNTTPPTLIDDLTYFPDIEYGLGDSQDGWYAIYKGIGNAVSVTGLTTNTQYTVAVFEYNGSAGQEKYLQVGASNNPNSFNTQSGILNNPAVAMAGGNEFVGISDSPSFNIDTNWTIEAWIKVPFNENDENIISQFDVFDGGYTLLRNGNTLMFHYVSEGVYRNGPSGFAMSHVGTFADNDWHHVAVSQNGTNGKLYVDGTLVLDFNNMLPIDETTVQVRFGNTTNVGAFTGSLDEVRFWDYQRTDQEIADNYTFQMTGTESGLVAYYPFNEAGGPGTADNTGNGNDGILFNGPTWVEGPVLTPAGADAPVIMNFGVVNIFTTNVFVDVNVDISSTLYYVVSTSDTPPTPAQIQSGLDGDSNPAFVSGNLAAAPGFNNYQISGLDPNTMYFTFWVAENEGLFSNVVDQEFTTLAEPTLTLTYPQGGEQLEQNSIVQIAWQTANYPYDPFVTLEYSVNGGTDWNFIWSGYSSNYNQTFNWYLDAATYPTGASYQVRVSTSDPVLEDIGGAFEIVEPISNPSITVNAPNGGEFYQLTQQVTVLFQATGMPSTQQIAFDYSTDNGGSWTEFEAGQLANYGGIHHWYLDPGQFPVSSEYRVRVRTGDGAVSDISDAAFEVAPAPAPEFFVQNPINEESIEQNTTYQVSFYANNLADYSVEVAIEYSDNNGAGWTTLATGTFESFQNGYFWFIDETYPVGSEYKLRVRTIDNAIIGESQGNFSIVAPSGVTDQINISSPNSGLYLRGGFVPVRFTTLGIPGTNQILIEYSTNGVDYTAITTQPLSSLSGVYDWTLDETVPEGIYTIRVTDISGTAQAVSSEFSVEIPGIVAINTTGATGGTLLQGATDQLIYTFSYAVSDADVQTEGAYLVIDGTYSFDDILSINLWSNTTDDFGSAALVTNATLPQNIAQDLPANSAIFLFENPYLAGSTTFFYVTVDVAAGATVGGTVFVETPTNENFIFGNNTTVQELAFVQGSLFTIGAGEISAPTEQASNVEVVNVGLDFAEISWISGNGDRRLVALNAGQAQFPVPATDVEYLANGQFGEGDDLGGGWFVVYDGTESFTAVSGLVPDTEYQVAVLEYNTNSTDVFRYNDNPAEQNPITFITESLSNVSLHFDGVNDYVEIPSDAFLNLGATFSIEAYVKPGGDNSGFRSIIDKRDAGTNQSNFSLSVVNGTDLGMFIDNGTQSLFTTVSGVMAEGRWNLVTATYNGQVLRMYVDGYLVHTFEQAVAFANLNVPVQIGRAAFDDEYFNGEIDEVRIWTNVLTPSEVALNTGRELNGNEFGLIAYYNLNDGIPGSDNSTVQSVNNSAQATLARPIDGVLNGFAKTGVTSNFVTSGAFDTFVGAPSAQATDVIISNTTTESFDISWTNGDGDRRIVAVFEGVLATMPALENNTYYAANADYLLSARTDDNWRVVYTGNGSSATVTGLKDNTTYTVAVMEMNGPANKEQYLLTTATGNPVNGATAPITPDITITTLAVTGSNIRQGKMNNLVYKLRMEVEGKDIVLSNLSLNLAGTVTDGDFVGNGWKLYESRTGDNITNFAAVTPLASSNFNAGVPSWTLNRGYSDGSVIHYYVVADVSQGASVGNTLNVATPVAGNFDIVDPDNVILTGAQAGSEFTIEATPIVTINSEVLQGIMPTKAAPGSVNNWVYKYNVVIDRNVNIQQVRLAYEGTLISSDVVAQGAKLWVNLDEGITTPTFSGGPLATANVGVSEIIFNIPQAEQVFTGPGTLQFWVSLDVSPTARIDNTFQGSGTVNDFTFNDIVFRSGAPTLAQEVTILEPDTYCDPTIEPISTAVGPTITNFSMPGISNTSQGNEDYHMFFLSQTAGVLSNTVQNASITTSANGFVKIWADWNQDQVFSEATELVVDNAAVTAGEPLALQIAVPTGIPTGLTRLRVYVYSENEWINGACDPVDQFTFSAEGQIHDYGISVVEPNGPTQTLAATNVGYFAFTANWIAMPGANFYRLDVAEDPQFTKLLVNNAGVTTNSYTVNTGLKYDKDYYYRVRVSYPAGLTANSNVTKARTQRDPLTAQDSAALVLIYNSTNGNSWLGATNWKVQGRRLETWAGVTMTGTRVTGLDLEGFGLEGNLPAQFSNAGALQALTSINLKDNSLYDVSVLNGLSALETVNVSDNQLVFDDIQPLLAAFDNFTYAPQKQVGESTRVIVPRGTDYTVRFIDLPADSYQWRRNGEIVPGAESTSYLVQDIRFETMGDFTLDMTDNDVPGLTLVSADQTVLASGGIEINVSDLNGLPLDEGVGYLLKIEEPGQPFDTTVVANFTDGDLFFDVTILGDYIISVEADPVLYLPTYFVETFLWEEADTLFFRDVAISSNMAMTAIPGPLNPNDPGSISGYLEIDVPDEEGARIEARRRAANVRVHVRRRVTGGRELDDEPQYVLIASVVTDENGEYSIPSLPPGFYRINFEYPGVPMDPNSFVEFEVTADGDNSAIQLAAVATQDGKIVVERIFPLSLADRLESYSVYPNPVRDVLTIDFKGVNSSALYLRMVAMNGQVVMEKALPRAALHQEQVNVSGLGAGMYFIAIVDATDGRVMDTFKVLVKK